MALPTLFLNSGPRSQAAGLIARYCGLYASATPAPINTGSALATSKFANSPLAEFASRAEQVDALINQLAARVQSLETGSADASSAPDKIQVLEAKGEAPAVRKDTATVSSFPAVIRFLAREAGQGHLLGGDDAFFSSQVEEWLGFLNSDVPQDGLSGDKAQAALTHLNNRLLSSAFLAAPFLTVVDIALFVFVKPVLALNPAQTASSYPNVVRWFATLQRSLRRFVQPSDVLTFTRPASQLQILGISQAGTAVSPVSASANDEKSSSKAAPAAAPAPAAAASAAAAPPAQAASSSSSAADLAAARAQKKAEKAAKQAAKAARRGEPLGGAELGDMPVKLVVGRIVSARQHQTNEKWLVEEVDVGSASGPITVVSGIAQHIPLADVKGNIIVCSNVAHGVMEEVKSEGRILVATSEDGKSKAFVHAPDGAKPGEVISIDGVNDKFELPVVKDKKLKKVLKDLATSKDGSVTYKGASLNTSAGVCSSKIQGGTVA